VARELRTGHFAVTAVTVFELQSGAKTDHARQQIERLLAAMKVLAFNDAAAAPRRRRSGECWKGRECRLAWRTT
jgi:predicted nucleic acid-binding protein